jgi:O-succinylbenzoic acid--CoA ligase
VERGDLARALGREPLAAGKSPTWVEDRDPGRFMASFADAVAAGGNVFLGNPESPQPEREALRRSLPESPCTERAWLMIPTGGSGGAVRFARHDGYTIAPAVAGFCVRFEVRRVNAVGVLPLHHVAGLMAWMRCAVTGGSYLPWSWRDLERGSFPETPVEGAFISLVPTQLQRLMALPAAADWLRRFRAVLLGGGPAWEALLGEAARLGLPLAPGYGATETAAMVACLTPKEFIEGPRDRVRALPHARIEVDAGAVRVTGESVFRGYYPEFSWGRTWESADRGRLLEDGSLVILGRSDDVIITGGRKVSASEVEAVLRETGEFDDAAVAGVDDPEWGQCVVACYPGGGRVPDFGKVRAALGTLDAHKRPKHYAALKEWPRDARGKISRAALACLAARALGRGDPAG